MPKGKKLGPRRIVIMKKASKKTGALCSLPLDRIADHFGISVEKNIPGKKNKKGVLVFPRGSKGAGSIQFPIDNGKTDEKSGGDKMMSFPIPSGVTHADIQLFVKTRMTKNKPTYYVSKGGTTRYLVDG